MFPLARIQYLKFAVAGALMTLTVAGAPARADELAQNLGPVSPRAHSHDRGQQASHSVLRAERRPLRCQRSGVGPH